MTERIRQAEKLLNQSGAACVVIKEDSTVMQSELTGIRPLIGWLGEDKCSLKGAATADRVVGKAAALLMLYGKVSEVYAQLISDSAAASLEQAGVPFTYGKKVPYIMNRDKTGMCPMEQRCLNIDSPKEAYEALSNMVGGPRHDNH